MASTARPSLFVVLASLLAAWFCAGCGTSAPAGGASPGSAGGAGSGTLVRVIDGDTLMVRLNGRNERVRLLGIDTPESVKPDTPVECWGHEATAVTKRLLPPGTPVRLVRDAEARDAYGRLLAYVYVVRTGQFINLALVRSGAAGLLTYPPNTTHAREFATAQDQARTQRVGIWQACGGNHQPASATSVPPP